MVKLQNTDNTQAGGDAEQRELSSWLVRMQNGAATSEDNLVVSYKAKHNLTIQSSNRTPCHLPKRAGELMSTQNPACRFYTSFIHNCQNLEATKCPSVGEWINYGKSRQWRIIQQHNEMSYQVMKR